MYWRIHTAALVSLLAGQAASVTQLHPGTGGSPHVRVEGSIHGTRIVLEYGRPYLKGRDLGSLAPAGRIWRTGADEATTLTTAAPLQFEGVPLAAGTYTLYTVPGERAWQLVINAQTGQWGTAYDDSLDIGRVPMRVSNADTVVEQLTISIDETPEGGAIRIAWGRVVVSAPFRVIPRGAE